MKKLLLSLPLSMSVCVGLFSATIQQEQKTNPELAWVDEQVAAIKPPRQGLRPAEIRHLRSPFIYLKKIKKKVTTRRAVPRTRTYRATTVKSSSNTQKSVVRYTGKLKLEAIINKSVLINGTWYKKGQKVAGYTIKEVNLNTAVLTKGTQTLVLSTKSQHSTLKFNNN